MPDEKEEKPLSLYKFCVCFMLALGGIIWIYYGNSERLWYFSVGAVLLSYPVGLFFNSVTETHDEVVRENRRKIVEKVWKDAKNTEDDNDIQ